MIGPATQSFIAAQSALAILCTTPALFLIYGVLALIGRIPKRKEAGGA